MKRRSCFLPIAAWVCLLGMFLGAESARSQDTIYWCKHDNGAEYGQKDPCAPGTEVRSSKATNGLSEGLPVQSAAPSPPLEAPQSTPEVAAPEVTAPAATAADHKDTLKEGQMAWLRLLGWGLVCGIIAKLFKRSFFLGFFLGIILRIVLVSADLVKF
jgi:hypothetical protein